MDIKTETTLNILLADDNENEHFFFKHAVKRLNIPADLHTVDGGVALMKYMSNDRNKLPHILFLDINMPLKNGKECLASLRSDPKFDEVSIVMYSTSDAQKDIDETYDLGADLYLQKPTVMGDLPVILKAVFAKYRSSNFKPKSRDKYLISISADH